MPKLEQWRKNLLAISVAQFIALGGAHLVFPFMPFYVEELGITDESAIALWSGLLGTATGATLFVFSPIWGSLADRYGRKPLLLRAYIGAMATVTLQGLVQNVWQLLFLRGLQGMFVGTIPAATALVAAGTPRNRVAYALGVTQMAIFVSQFAGPLAGGVLATSIGFRPTFVAVGGLYVVSFLLVLLVVEEKFERPSEETRTSFLDSMRSVLSIRPLVVLIGVVFFLNLGPTFIRPIIPLAVKTFDASLSPESLAGIAFAALAVTSAGTALMVDRVSSRVGFRNALALATFGAGVAYLPVAIATGIPSFLLLMAIVGLFSGALIPTANALIDAWAPPERQAAAFGLSGSALALAFAVGPLSGGIVASAASVSTSFLVIGAVTMVVSVAVYLLVQEPPARGASAADEA